ncbi:MAG TPA: sigma-70 family RNA polymerase sigma factor [Verrucomicrobiae bacterium]|jgi:RNA polymerase sigma-70 factor (ECF subfamily)
MPEHNRELIRTRETLIKRLKNWSDHESWRDFFDIYWRLIFIFARKRGLSETEAQDVVQETMISVAKHMPNFEYDPKNGSFKKWLLTMTGWRIADQVRKRSPFSGRRAATANTDSSAVADLDNIADPSLPSPETMWNEEWKKNLYEVAVSKVKRENSQNFQIFDLFVNQRQPAEKIATAFNTTANNVHVTKHRVAEAIKREVKRLESAESRP